MKLFRKQLTSAIWLLACLPAVGYAQLYGDYNPEDFQRDHPANVYFGSVKDEGGNYIQGVTVVLASARLDFVAVTDARGRFRMELPVDIAPEQVDAGCSRAGYTDARVIKRPPRRGALSPVEVNCILR